MSGPDQNWAEGLEPAEELYIWGYPLLAVQRTRRLFCSRSDTGRLNHVDDLATPADKGVVAPNNDTLYSSGFYDLRHGDLVIDVPPMDHAARYWNVMILDAYTHVAYVCRRHFGTNGTRVRVTFDPDSPPPNDDSTIVPIATPTAWVIVRMLVESTDDLAQARSLQRAITVTAPEDHPVERTMRAGRPTAIAQAGAEFFDELAACVRDDPPAPWHPTLSDAAGALLADPSTLPEAERAAGIEAGERRLKDLQGRDAVVRNGWSSGRGATGFGGDAIKRAAGAKFGLGGHQAIENRSYVALADAEGHKLDGRTPLALRLRQADLPPCNGFWSLTAYGPDLYLVENEIDRWSLGDRTKGLERDADGTLTLTLSAERPANDSNWLPVPEGPYLLGMRVYEGHSIVVDCEWFPPALHRGS